MSERSEHEVVILGGGPAGCSAATLLAQRGHEVALVRPRTPPAGALACSVPPSARKLLTELGLQDAVDRASFHPNLGNTVWWAGHPARSEAFAQGEAGVHVDRSGLETALVGAAEQVGVRVFHGVTARSAQEGASGPWSIRCTSEAGPEHTLSAGWLLDATGRHGLLARREGRIPDRSTTTLALVGRWARHDGWGAAVRGHTLIESYEDGWAWSVPLDRRVRCFTAMVDQRHAELDGSDIRAMLTAELAKAKNLGGMLGGASPVGSGWACPASLYSASRYGRAGLLLVGDAGSFIDPLSSYGIKKALSSGWLAAVATHTALIETSMTDTVAQYFDEREKAVYRRYRAVSAAFFDEAARTYEQDYWTLRADAARDAGAAAGTLSAAPGDPDDLDGPPVPEGHVRAAFDELRQGEGLNAAKGPTLRVFERPAVVGQRIVLAEHLASDRTPQGVRWVRGVDLRALVELAPEHDDVPESWSAYNRVAAPVSLPDFLTALSTAFAAGFLVHPPD